VLPDLFFFFLINILLALGHPNNEKINYILLIFNYLYGCPKKVRKTGKGITLGKNLVKIKLSQYKNSN